MSEKLLKTPDICMDGIMGNVMGKVIGHWMGNGIDNSLKTMPPSTANHPNSQPLSPITAHTDPR